NFSQRFETEVARGWIAFMISVPRIPLPPISLGLNPRRAVTGDIAHPCRWSTSLIDPLGVFAAGHLQSIPGARKFHSLYGPGRHYLKHDAATADQICRAWQHLNCGYATRQYARQLRILRPNRVFCPNVCGYRIGSLVTVAIGIDARSWINADVRMHINYPGRYVFAGAINTQRVRRRLNRLSHRRDFSITQQH